MAPHLTESGAVGKILIERESIPLGKFPSLIQCICGKAALIDTEKRQARERLRLPEQKAQRRGRSRGWFFPALLKLNFQFKKSDPKSF